MPKLTMQSTSKDLTLQGVFDKFISFKKIKNLSEESIQYYEECFKFFTEYYPASRPCADITKDICLGYVQHLRETRPGVKDVTINTYLRAVRAILYYAMEQEYLPRFKMELIKAEKEIKETYTDDELARLLKKPNMKQCRELQFNLGHSSVKTTEIYLQELGVDVNRAYRHAQKQQVNQGDTIAGISAVPAETMGGRTAERKLHSFWQG